MISVIVPLYFNELDLYPIIRRCLASIPREGVELIVIDDCSPLDTDDFQEGNGWWLHNPENLGYTKTVNIGLKEASGDVFVIMNDDITLKPGQLDRFFNLPDGIFSPKTSEEGKGDRFGSIWGMNRATYEKLAPLDPTLPHFFSDAEYYDRAKRLGVPITKWYDIVVDHVGGATYKHVNKAEMYEKDHAHYRDMDGRAA